ncbi:sigma-70 family RNA polymerase sigma factor [Stieleria sp. TO1_6]|uniref:sigma-70 family RNA polymerase sigma factor n=1 Tax=Stieleria tagensis TaxID=2956795 RepID=UPI00209BAE09|nr:sigma-70 family RNA polymerase sigma factor [Stieleria tagensis]MCO8123188.1 sigma-70 family RNA polymerase sigma factor [Stieleria tagensis]
MSDKESADSAPLSPQLLLDRDLVRRVAAGEDQAMREVFDQHFETVFRICMHQCRQSADAQEVSEIVFVELWNFPQRFHPQRGSLRTYLCLLARSRAKDRLRQTARRAQNQESAEIDLKAAASQKQRTLDPAAHAESNDRRKLVRTILDSLPVEFRTVLELAFFESQSHREIAETLDLPIGTVKSRVRRGLIRVSECLKATGVVERTEV